MKESAPESQSSPEWLIVMTPPGWTDPVIVFHWEHRVGYTGGAENILHCWRCSRYAPDFVRDRYEKLYKLMSHGE